MSEITVSLLTVDQARDLTEEVKADAASLWAKLLTLYEGEAHIALGYGSWGEYYAEEFGQTGTQGYRLLDSARVIAALPEGHSPMGERVAREIAPVLKSEGATAVEEVWGEVVEQHGPAPTAAQVREVVTDRAETPPVGPRKQGQQHKLVAAIAEKARHIHDLSPHLDFQAIHSLHEEEKHQWEQQLRDARTVLSRVIEAL